jgi:uncharacterized protein (TIGR02996 family)
MNERELLLRAVCENPDEDAPRLVFADWLQENGEEEQAEFIRLQIEIAGLPDGKKKLKKQEREKALLDAHGEEWAEPLRSLDLSLVAYQKPTPRSRNGIEFRRGFPYGLQIDEGKAQFADHAAKLFRCAPVQRISFYHQWGYTKLAACPELLRLRELSLDRSGYETPELVVFFGSKFLKNVTRLELIADDDNGHLAPDGIELLSKTRSLPALRHLDLSHNWCGWEGDDGWVETFAKGKLSGQLESLFLRGTLIGDKAARTLAHCRRLHSLKHLDLSCNYVGEDGARAVATTKNLPKLTTLDLRQNLPDTDQAISLVTRQILQARLGKGVLIDGRVDD